MNSLGRFVGLSLVGLSASLESSAATNAAVLFDGSNDYITMGTASALGVSAFTIETWFKRTGLGISTSTGTGGINAVPLVAKGRGEADGSNLDMNFFLGIRSSDGVLAADFEEGAGGPQPGLNHPIAGATPVPNNVWVHAAVTYDGAIWRLYLNGVLDAQLAVNRPPRADSIQHASLASALTSGGAAAGFFQGVLDEVRIWNYARSAQEIAANRDGELTSAAGLIARWGLNEASGTVANNSSGSVQGTLRNGPTWTGGFATNAAPPPPPPASSNYAVQFDGANDYVTFGAASAVNAASFTIETWFKRTGPGISTSTGSGGLNGIPLVTKGRAEADGNSQDMNWFLGIRGSDGVLAADFEEGGNGPSPGLNHPIAGTTRVPSNVWVHAAATYDGAIWRLYLNGTLDAQLTVNRPVRADSIQHAALASALTSSGSPAGFFRGVLDEVRIWNYARTAQEIAANKNAQITSAPGLLARWGLNEGSGTVAGSSAGVTVNGTLVNGPTWVAGFDTNAPPSPPPPTNLPVITRGPYLQLGTPTSIVVRWRTDVASSGRVRFGPSVGSLNSFVDDPNITTEHIVQVGGLTPDSLYYYSVGTTNAVLAGDASSFFFATSPRIGTAVPTRIWVLGDSGTRTASQYAVRDAYYNFTGSRATDLWLMLGDNAYTSGTDAEFEGAVFNAYPTTLRNSVVWPTVGNHDTPAIYNPNSPYFQMFTLPTRGEAGGVASGTEQYYSFDFGNIHFICLDSWTASRAPDGAMANWLVNDLAANLGDWIIAYWHHPPYSKGSHNSDTATDSTEMRQTFLPILEAGGVDLVLGGHSHVYERSYLLDGHYGTSSSLTAANIINGGNGRAPAPYQKPVGNASHAGAVYVVAGSSGQISGGTLDHPAMYIGLNVLGSLVIDVMTNEMNVIFLDNNGTSRDTFTMVKPSSVSPSPAAPSGLAAKAVTTRQIVLTWSGSLTNTDGFEIERSTDNKTFTLVKTVDAKIGRLTDEIAEVNRRYYYRVRAFNRGGSSAYSGTATAKTRRH